MSNQYPSYHNYNNQQQAQQQDNMNHNQPPQYQVQVLSHQFHAPNNLLPMQPTMSHRQHIPSSFPTNGSVPGTDAFVTTPTNNPFNIPQGIPPQSLQQNYVLPLPASIISNVKNKSPLHPDTSPTRKRLQSRLQVPTASPHPQQTPKKKRGRPPKPDSLAQKITTTLNISVNTSPLNSTPAESNSNLMVRQGAPDIFTPLMRVSPTSKSQRRKRKLSTSSNGSNQSSSSPTTNNGSPTTKKSRPTNTNQSQKPGAFNDSISYNKNQHLVTPLSTSGETHFSNPESSYQINYKTLDNMSMITQSQGYYNTPPPTSTRRNFSTPRVNQKQHLDNLPESNNPTPLNHNNQANHSRASPHLAKINEIKHESKNLLPPVSLTSQSLMNERNNNNNNNNSNENITKNIPNEQEIAAQNHFTCESFSSSDDRINGSTSRKSSDDFLFRLTIDELGKAVLSSDVFAPIASGDKNEMQQQQQQQQQEITSETKEQLADDFSTVPAPSKVPSMLPHTKSVIGIESMHSNEVKSKAPLRRHNSDITDFSSSKDPAPQILAPINEASNNNPPSNFNNPQTPRESYAYVSTGLTPLFNLTPQFNSLMYSVMNLNASPAYRKPNNPFLINQELFTNGDNADIVQRSQHLEELVEHPRLEKLHEKSNAVMMEDLVDEKNPNNTTMDTHNNDILTGGAQDVAGHANYLLASSSEDSGDARLALKKIIHVKRK